MKMKNIKKLIASTALSAALVFGAVSTASAFQYDRGDFVIGIMGTTIEMGIEMGAIAYESPDTMYDIPVARYDNLFDVNNVGATFNGDDLQKLSLVGYASTTHSQYYRGYFAVQEGWTNTGNPNTMDTKHTALSSFSAATVDAGAVHNDGTQDGYTMYTVGDRSIKWGMADGVYNGFLDDLPQPGHGQYGTFEGLKQNPDGNWGLESLASGGIYTMDIWMDGDDYYGAGSDYSGNWDYSPTKTGYVLRVGVAQNDLNGDGDFLDPGESMAYAETAAVPVPAAVWLLGSGFLAIMGMRRRNNG